MKIKTRLIVSTWLLLLGMAAIAATRLLALRSVGSSVHQFANESVPHQLRTNDVLRTTEKLAGNFLRLGMSTSEAQQEKFSAVIDADIQSLDAMMKEGRQRDEWSGLIDP